jgi:hypothetical protein
MGYSRRRLPDSSSVRNVSLSGREPKKLHGFDREKNLRNKYVPSQTDWLNFLFKFIFNILYMLIYCTYLTLLKRTIVKCIGLELFIQVNLN